MRKYPDKKNQSHQQFAQRKLVVLSKRDKSSAGRIDPRAVAICSAINSRNEYYTTSSCSGRCFLYVGDGIKSWHKSDGNNISSIAGRDGVHGKMIVESGNDFDEATAEASNKMGFFQRFRVSHEKITNPTRYFNLQTLTTDATGGCGDPIPSVGQFENFGNNAAFREKLEKNSNNLTPSLEINSDAETQVLQGEVKGQHTETETPIWLRYEPFILHVMCRSLKSASVLMSLARPSFKNVGLTSWNTSDSPDEDDDEDIIHNFGEGNDAKDAVNRLGDNNRNRQPKGRGAKYLVAIWGDEGLDMPLSLPSSPRRGLFYNPDSESEASNAEWLAQLVNERHMRNWSKIERFVEAVKSMAEGQEVDTEPYESIQDETGTSGLEEFEGDWYREKHDDLGDGANSHEYNSNSARSARLTSGLPIPRSYDIIGDVAVLNSVPEGNEEVLKMICVARTNSLSTTDRSPGENGFLQLAGPPRYPIVTSHYEYGIKCVVDLHHTFFSPRMAPERLRLSQQVARGERVLVVFAGIGMEALLIAARTEASEVVAIEKNAVAAECLRRAKRMLERNKTATCPGSGKGAAERLHIMEGDALDILPTLDIETYDRIIAPRPKEGALDGDLGTGDAGAQFLSAMLPLLKSKGEMHWYDFAADHELPRCDRTRRTLEGACQSLGLKMEVIHVSKVGSVAKRQLRVCVDFRIMR
eukprot:CCRYP_016130-RA/>CCRYP_016130-RA protein AED:0.07 eAED:0.07 QI:0/0/0.5/1/0/0.5/2/91/696